jgi:hypothetical protein
MGAGPFPEKSRAFVKKKGSGNRVTLRVAVRRNTVKVKLSLYRLGQAMRAPGG